MNNLSILSVQDARNWLASTSVVEAACRLGINATGGFLAGVAVSKIIDSWNPADSRKIKALKAVSLIIIIPATGIAATTIGGPAGLITTATFFALKMTCTYLKAKHSTKAALIAQPIVPAVLLDQNDLPTVVIEPEILEQLPKDLNFVSFYPGASPALTPLPNEQPIPLLSLQEFKKKLKNFDICKKSPEQIAVDLFKLAPENLNLNEIVNFIFDERDHNGIPTFLDALLLAYPMFSLSPIDKIRKIILEDLQYRLTNDSLITMLREYGLDTDEDAIAACYDQAYYMNHRSLCRVSKTPVLAHDYNLNFLWINLNPQDRIQNLAENIFKDGSELSENAECIKDPAALRFLEETEESLKGEDLENWTKIKNSFTYRLSRWADVNPGAQINLWYDSALVTQKAQQNTFEMMESISKSRGVNLKLRDIRQLPNIQGEIENCLHPAVPVYFRIDLLKVLIADYMIGSTEENGKYCVVTDIDVQRMNSQQLFDHRTLGYLSSNGYVLNRVGTSGFENSFFIFNKEKENLQKIHYKYIIQRTESYITSIRRDPINISYSASLTLGSQFIFSQYLRFLESMNEDFSHLSSDKNSPRKIVQCPSSQFGSGQFSEGDHQKETFRFIGSCNIPYTRFGRNFDISNYNERKIEALIDWKAEPLALRRKT